MAITVVGLVNTARDAETLVRDLTHHCRCNPTDITLTNLRDEGGRSSGGGVAMGAMKGLIGGALLGAVLGFVVGAMQISIPAFESVIERGPSATIIVGAVIFAVLGIVIGALGGMEKRHDGEYSDEDAMRRAGTLVTIHARENQEADCAVNVLRHHGAREIDKRSSDWNKNGWNETAAAQDYAQEPTLRSVPDRAAANAPAPDAGLRYNRPMEEAARASAHEQAAYAREQLAAGSAAREQVATQDTTGWITRKYTATYFGPERRKAANQTPYQGAEKRHST